MTQTQKLGIHEHVDTALRLRRSSRADYATGIVALEGRDAVEAARGGSINCFVASVTAATIFWYVFDSRLFQNLYRLYYYRKLFL
jgi:hypothetical protein